MLMKNCFSIFSGKGNINVGRKLLPIHLTYQTTGVYKCAVFKT